LSSLPGFVNARIRTDRSNTAVSFVDYDSADAALNAKRLAEGRGLGVQFAASSTKDPARAGAAAVSAGNDRMKRQRDGGGYEHQHGGGGRMWGGDGFGGGMHAGPGMHGAHAGAGYGPPMGAGLGMMGAMGLHGSMMGHAGPRMPMGADAMGARGGGAYDRGHNDGWESARDDFRQPQQLSEPAPSGGSSQAVAVRRAAPRRAALRCATHAVAAPAPVLDRARTPSNAALTPRSHSCAARRPRRAAVGRGRARGRDKARTLAHLPLLPGLLGARSAARDAARDERG
jgi:hypothetical protein